MSLRARAAIDEAPIRFVSAVNALEIATKYRLGKLPSAERLALDFETVVTAKGFSLLSISATHARVGGSLLIPHKDPFDRILVAQAMTEGLTIISNERVFDSFGVARLW